MLPAFTKRFDASASDNKMDTYGLMSITVTPSTLPHSEMAEFTILACTIPGFAYTSERLGANSSGDHVMMPLILARGRVRPRFCFDSIDKDDCYR